MGNESPQNPVQQLKQLADYQEVSRRDDGIIFKKKISSKHQQASDYYILKERSYHSQDTCKEAFQKYKESLVNNQHKQSNTLAIKQVFKEQIQHFCSNSFKIYTLYEYPELTLKDQIDVRGKQSKYFEQSQIVAILQTCILALDQISSIICFGAKYIFVSPQGIIKVIHSDLVDQNYRHVVTPNTYYAPEKLTNFMIDSSAQLALRKEIIFSIGMTLLQTCKLQELHDLYNYNNQTLDGSKLEQLIQALAHRYSSQLIELISNMVEINPNRRISLPEIERFLNQFDEEEADANCNQLFGASPSTLPQIKESNQTNEEPTIPNLLTHQNTSRVSFSKNQGSKVVDHSNFYRNIDKSLQNFKVQFNLPSNSYLSSNNLTAHFTTIKTLSYQPLNQAPQLQHSKQSNEHLFTDPKLLEMIKKDLEQINKSRTSRIMNKQMKNSYVNTSLNTKEASQTNKLKSAHGNQEISASLLGRSSFDNQAKNHPNYGQFITLQNCPQVKSLAASVAYDSSGQKKIYLYEESQVKKHLDDRLSLLQDQNQMKNSVALSVKNFDSNHSPRKNQKSKEHSENNKSHQSQLIPEQSTVRYHLRQINLNLNQCEIKAAMMKKKEANLVYLEEVYEDGVKYEGMSKNGLKQGYGKLIYSDGAYYEGFFQNDKINGKGTLYYRKNQPAYEGEWLDEQFNGYGLLYNQEPEELQGSFPYENWNLLENYWTKYEGLFVKDSKHGLGKIYLTTHDYIEGHFEDDMLNGWAKFYQQNGSPIEGRWQNNILVELKSK